MTVKELKEVLVKFPDNAEIWTSDYDTRKKVRGVSDVGIMPGDEFINLRLWLTDEECFEEERKRAEEDRKNTEYLLKVNKNNKYR